MASRALAVIVLLVVLATGCASGDSGVEVAAPETTPLEPAETNDESAPADPVSLIGGGQFDLGSIEGTDTVLWFWAPW